MRVSLQLTEARCYSCGETEHLLTDYDIGCRRTILCEKCLTSIRHLVDAIHQLIGQHDLSDPRD